MKSNEEAKRTQRGRALIPASVGDEPTGLDRGAVDALYETVLPQGTKGLPLGATDLTLRDVAESGWNIFADGLPMPLMVLKERALANNIATMVEYCRAQGVLLCPHGKTTMAPQLFRRQIDAGAWGLTAATPSHLRTYRRFGVRRILYANPLVEPTVIDWLADELERAPEFEFLCLVDSLETVAILTERLSSRSARVQVLLEIGYPGGRCGARDDETVMRVAAAVDASPCLELRGIECFEALLSRDASAEGLGRIDAFLETVRVLGGRLCTHSSLSDADALLVSAGGSAYFDRVVRAFVPEWPGVRARVVLRSGCYVTHDQGFYEEVSPLAGRRDGPPLLEDAIEIWSAVLSRPEPGLAISNMGRRDAPVDMGMPVPRLALLRSAGGPTALQSAAVRGLNDQHAHIIVEPASGLSPGDLIGCSISHPCTAFDRWRVIPVVDDSYTVRDAVLTFF